MLKHRAITGGILVIAFLAIVWLDDWLDGLQLSGFVQTLFRGKEHPPHGLLLFALSLLVIAPAAALELSNVLQANGIRTRRWLTILAAMLGLVMSYSIPMGTRTIETVAILSTGMILVFVASLLTFSRHQNVEGVVAAAGAVVFAMVYLGLMLGFLLALRRSHSAWWIVGVIITTKMSDTGAYFSGRALGRHKLIPWLSPGKTWEGLFGGVVAAAGVGVALALASRLLPSPADLVPWWLGALGGAIFGVVGQFGDLTMSLLKRGGGMKDSSSALPGLGGVLDVLDSPLMVAPVAYWLLEAATGV